MRPTNHPFPDLEIDDIQYKYYLKSIVQDSQKLKMFLWALHNNTRLSILEHLAEKPLCVKELSHKIGELHSATSFHLKHLRIYKLVEFREDGKERIYNVTNIIKPLSEAVNTCNNIFSKSDNGRNIFCESN